jgi:uncharacterized repeat protein (TIGR01451 family)
MRLYTLDQTRIAAAWGQDPATADPGNPFLDLGTAVLPIPEILMYKQAALETDLDSDGLVDPGERLVYTITVDNNSAVGIATVIVSDTLFAYTSYVTGTTKVDGAPVPDDSVPPALTELPLDEGGIDIGPLPVNATTEINYIVTVSGSLPSEVDSILNEAGLDADDETHATENEVPVQTADFTYCSLGFTDAGGTPVTTYVEEDQITVTVDDGDQNTDSGSLQTVIVNVLASDGHRQCLELRQRRSRDGDADRNGERHRGLSGRSRLLRHGRPVGRGRHAIRPGWGEPRSLLHRSDLQRRQLHGYGADRTADRNQGALSDRTRPGPGPRRSCGDRRRQYVQ